MIVMLTIKNAFSFEVLHNLIIYAEVEILVVSNWRPIVDKKNLVASNLELITVTSDVNVFYFTLV
jgi:hypothetical protein